MTAPFKRILTPPEAVTYGRLQAASKRHGTELFPKIRLADILPIEHSGITTDQYRFALQAHFDFVIGDADHRPLFAVEMDGASHRDPKQAARDTKKDALCERFDLPLLRITSAHVGRTYRRLDLLSWFIELWFANQAIADAYASGSLPPDEYVDAQSFVEIPGLPGRFPLWLSAEPLIAMRRLADAGKCRDPLPSYFIGRDTAGVYRGMAWMAVSDKAGVVTTTAMRKQKFPILESDTLHEVLMFQAHDALVDVLERNARPVPLPEIDRRISAFTGSLTMCCAGGCSRSPAK